MQKTDWKDWVQTGVLVLLVVGVIYLFSVIDDSPKPPDEEPGDAIDAIGRIAMQGGYCSGTVIGPKNADGRYVIVSANHCFSFIGETATFFLRDTSTPIPIVVVALDERADIAICKTENAMASLPWIQVAEQNPTEGTKIFHAGFGTDNPGNIEEGVVSGGPTMDNQMKYTLSVSPGDSGGGICVTAAGRLLSPVCCTTCVSCRGTVYGGSPEHIRKMIKSPTAFMVEMEPVEMPEPPEE